VLHFFQSTSPTRASLPVLLDIGNDEAVDKPTAEEEVLAL